MLDVTLADEVIQTREALTIFPLISDQGNPLPHKLLAEALSKDTVNVLELGQGNVPTLVVENLGLDPVLILDGEQLIGARQSRMASRSVVVPEQSKTEIPVSCIEHGRWHFTSRKFKAGRHYSPTRVRKKVRDLEANMAGRGAAMHADPLSMAQGEVWKEIEKVQDSMDYDSPTDSLDDVSRSVEDEVVDWAQEFPLIEAQIGVLAFLRDRPLALDLIGSPKLYGKIHDRMMRGYIMDALSMHRTVRPGSGFDVMPERAGEFLEAVSASTSHETPTVGVGSYYVLSGEVTGGRLEQEVDGVDRVIHLTAFPVDRDTNGHSREDSGRGAAINRSSRRGW